MPGHLLVNTHVQARGNEKRTRGDKRGRRRGGGGDERKD